jgi:hypothetical protein
LASSKEAIAGYVPVKVRILSSALSDLVDGRVFYDSQGEYLGDYFFNTLFSDIDSLALYTGIHPIVQGFHKLLSETFPYALVSSVTFHAGAGNVIEASRDRRSGTFGRKLG